MMLHRDLVRVTPGFKAAINLAADWDDRSKIAAYIPTRFALRTLHEIAGALQAAASARVLNIHGPYGVGKSHLGLTIAAFLRQPFHDGWLKEPFLKMGAMDPERTAEIVRDRAALPSPMLVVRLYGSEAPTREALLHALDQALAREGLSDLLPETAFSAAISRIQEIEEVYPASVPAMVEAFRSVGYGSANAVREELAEYRAEALSAFARVHPRFSAGAAFGQHHGQNPGDVFQAVAIKLQRESGQRKRAGIAVLWDEFTVHAERVMADPANQQYIELQAFLETCDSSGPARLLFLSLSHRSVVQTVSTIPGLDSNQQEALKKVAGRFTERPIRQEEGEQYRLIGRVLIPTDSTAREQLWRSYASYYGELESQLTTLKLFSSLTAEHLRLVAFRDVYPLHPAVLYLLPLLSERVAQNDRTLFHFLADAGPHALPAFLSEPVAVDEHPNLLPVDRLFAYFAESIASARQEEIRVVYSRYRRLKPLSEAQQRLVNTLLLLQVARAPQLPATAANLGFALGFTSSREYTALRVELEVLKRAKVLREGPDQVFELRRLDQEVDFEEAWEAAERDVPNGFDALSQLKQWTSRARVGVFVQATGHNRRFKTERMYEPVLITSDHLRLDRYQADGKPHEVVDGACYWVMPLTDRELAEARQYAETFTNNRILIISPREPLGLLPDLRKYLALRQLEKLAVFSPKGGLQRDEWDSAFDELQQKIRDRLAYCFASGSAYVGGTLHHYTSVENLEQIASNGMDATFPLSLTIPHEKLASAQGNDTQRQYRMPVVDALLDKHKDFGQFVQHTPAPSRLVVQAVLQENGWLRSSPEGWEVGCPSPEEFPAGHKVWQIIETFLKSRKLRPFTFLVHTLSEPPYGVRHRVLPVLLAAAIRPHLDSLEFFEGAAERIEPSASLVEKIVRDPSKVSVRYAQITEQQYFLLEAVMDAISLAPLDQKAALSQVVNVVSRRAQKIAGLARTIRTGTPAKVSACRDRFYLPLGDNPTEEQARAIVYEVLPDLAEIADLRNSNRSYIRDKVMPLLSSVDKELRQAVERSLLSAMAVVLHCEPDPAAIATAVREILSLVTPERLARLPSSQQQIIAALHQFRVDQLEESVSRLVQPFLTPGKGLSEETLSSVGPTGEYAMRLVVEELRKPLPPPPQPPGNIEVVAPPDRRRTGPGDGRGQHDRRRDEGPNKGPGGEESPESEQPPPKAPELERLITMEISIGGRTHRYTVPAQLRGDMNLAFQAVRAGLNRVGVASQVEVLAAVLREILPK